MRPCDDGNPRRRAPTGTDARFHELHVLPLGKVNLVIADDVKEPTRKLMGWVGASAFSAGEAPRKIVASDAGSAVTVDAGAKPVTVADAGTKPGPLRPLDIHKSADGSCASGYAPCSALCRATCKVASDCGPLPLISCTGGFCMGLGAQACK